MRTTVNLDDELLRRAKRHAAAADQSLSAFVADAIREALARRSGSARGAGRPVTLTTVAGGLCEGVDHHSFAALNELAEREE